MVKIIAKKVAHQIELETSLIGNLPNVTIELTAGTVSVLKEILESLPEEDRLWYLQNFIKNVYNELSTKNINNRQKDNEYGQRNQ